MSMEASPGIFYLEKGPGESSAWFSITSPSDKELFPVLSDLSTMIESNCLICICIKIVYIIGLIFETYEKFS